MKIGIDIDDTITNTTEKIYECMKSLEIPVDTSLDYSNFTISEFDKYKEILRKYIEPVFSSLTVKDGCVDTIKKLKEDGNTIYIITARSNRYSDNIYDLTVDYLNKNGIIYDKLLFGYENKKDICIEEGIDYMIDDNVSIYDSLIDTSIKPILFGKGDNRTRIDSWSEVLDILK